MDSKQSLDDEEEDNDDLEIGERNSLTTPLLGAAAKGPGEEEEDTALPPSSFLELFSFADRLDTLLIFVGCISACLSGIIMPLFSIVFGNLLDSFQSADPRSAVNRNALYFVYLAFSSFFLNIFMQSSFSVTSERQMRRMREESLRATLRQEITFFDSGSHELSTRIKGDTLVVQQGIGMKLGRLVRLAGLFVLVAVLHTYGTLIALLHLSALNRFSSLPHLLRGLSLALLGAGSLPWL
jgi:ATP-binding cassette subfamily B (MDR/TAP) protein 1